MGAAVVTADVRGQPLPRPVRDLLDGSSLREKSSTSVLLGTVSSDGWPNLAVLSPGEVLATDPWTVRLALHSTSQTCRSLRTGGRGLLSVVAEGAAYRIRISVRHVQDPPVAGADEFFEARVDRVSEDSVPYARLLAGITYRLDDVDDALARWEEKLHRLRNLA
jgi:hypothetical protein